MNCNDVKPGLRVKTTELGDTRGMTIVEKHLKVREEGVTGTITRHVPGHGGDVWFVRHDNSENVGAYSIDEMEPV
ncbi:MAG: hypothetical protein A2854_05010 [Parcubacteria group bacterium RIFCSPHIGHO2_01_FULL_56_18]|nr:MAG: hypothetical protein A2854_05010 [Parcubacteria group bacterium RIFCSPHIGHO2_01_FULL_56_18]